MEEKTNVADVGATILKFAASSSIMASATAMSMIAVPVTAACPPLGAMIIFGNVIATSALSETIVDPWIDRKMEGAAEYAENVKKKFQEIIQNTEKETQKAEGNAE